MTKQLLSLFFSALLPLGACTSAVQPSGGAVTAAATPTYPAAIAFDDFEASYENRTQNQVGEAFVGAIEDFSAQTSARLLSGEENACYSPASLYFALSLSAAGARGDSQRQLLDLLGEEDAAALAGSCAKLYRLLYTDNEVGQLKIANSLWMADQIGGAPVTFEKSFLDTASKDFYASLFTGDLTAPATLEAMKQWVQDNTGGKITPQYEADPLALLYLLNTVYLKDEWTDRFRPENNTVAPFHRADGSTQNAAFMNRGSLSGFTRGQDYTMAGLGLKNAGGVYFVLPDQGVPLDSLLTESRLAEILAGGSDDQQRYGHVYWAVPKFSYDTRLDLAGMLKACGVTDLFSPDKADLTGMTSAPAFLASAKQQTYIAVDENGVEAAAYTELGSAGSAMPEDEAYMTLDRPFLYVITAQNGTPLFVGVCAEPTAA